MALEEGRPIDDAPAPPDAGEVRRLDDDDLIASMRAMSMRERLESGFELCEFASELAGAAHR
jgi:hypothetical protein